MPKLIKFHANDEYTMQVKEKPVPASSLIPKWFKNMPMYSTSNNKFDINPYATVTSKQCAPLLDTFCSGYIVKLWSDLLVSRTEDSLTVRWLVDEKVVDNWHHTQSSMYEVPDEFDSVVFKYYHGWSIETPPGYSCLITHPFAYQNLPIRTLTGIIDSDILKLNANSPFVIKKNFEGIIKKGTPMFQIIPFKREAWDSEYDVSSQDEKYFDIQKFKTKIVSSYASARHKKIFK